MQIRYYKEYSRYLDRYMEFKAYGPCRPADPDLPVPERPFL